MTDSFIYTVSDKPSTHYEKERLIRDLSLFLIRNGYKEIYISEIRSAPRKKCSHISYIFTEAEMARIFKSIDSWEDSFYTNRNLIDPVLFRLIYGMGMRVSETQNLLVKDFNSVEDILTVYHAKNNKDRMIPLSPSLTMRIIKFIENFHRYSNVTDYLFSERGGRLNPHSSGNAASFFSLFQKLSNFSGYHHLSIYLKEIVFIGSTSESKPIRNTNVGFIN